MSKKYLEARSCTGISNKKVISKFGMKIMSKLGWNEGDGLGKNGTGRKDIIQVRRRQDNLALGAEVNSTNWSDKWWESSYDKILQTIKPDLNNTETEDEGISADETIAEDIKNKEEEKKKEIKLLSRKRKRKIKLISI